MGEVNAGSEVGRAMEFFFERAKRGVLGFLRGGGGVRILGGRIGRGGGVNCTFWVGGSLGLLFKGQWKV